MGCDVCIYEMWNVIVCGAEPNHYRTHRWIRCCCH